MSAPRGGVCPPTTPRGPRCTRPAVHLITATRALTRLTTCFSEADVLGKDDTDSPDSQAYLAHVATRAIVLIQANDAAIGLTAFVAGRGAPPASCSGPASSRPSTSGPSGCPDAPWSWSTQSSPPQSAPDELGAVVVCSPEGWGGSEKLTGTCPRGGC